VRPAALLKRKTRQPKLTGSESIDYWRLRPVHREPLLRLAIAVVQKLGRHLAKPKAVEQLSLNGMRKLTVMNDHVCRRSSKATF
jgi:hypothetical protein